MRGKPKGINRESVRAANTLLEKLWLCRNGQLKVSKSSGGLGDAYDLIDSAQTLRYNDYGRKNGWGWGVHDSKLPGLVKDSKKNILDAIVEAIANHDSGFFERIIKAMKLTDITDYYIPIDKTGYNIVQYLWDETMRNSPCEKYVNPRSYSSGDIVAHLSALPGASADGVDDGTVRRICRELGINLPYTPGDIPTGSSWPRGT